MRVVVLALLSLSHLATAVGPPPAPQRRHLTHAAVFRSADAKSNTVRVGLIGTNHRGEVVLSDQVWRVAADLKVVGRDGRALQRSDLKKGTPVGVTVLTKMVKEKKGRKTVLSTVMTGPVVEIEVAGPTDFPLPPAKDRK
jgi:hypothetical protein